jgi:hypothetical protein
MQTNRPLFSFGAKISKLRKYRQSGTGQVPYIPGKRSSAVLATDSTIWRSVLDSRQERHRCEDHIQWYFDPLSVLIQLVRWEQCYRHMLEGFKCCIAIFIPKYATVIVVVFRKVEYWLWLDGVKQCIIVIWHIKICDMICHKHIYTALKAIRSKLPVH